MIRLRSHPLTRPSPRPCVSQNIMCKNYVYLHSRDLEVLHDRTTQNPKKKLNTTTHNISTWSYYICIMHNNKHMRQTHVFSSFMSIAFLRCVKLKLVQLLKPCLVTLCSVPLRLFVNTRMSCVNTHLYCKKICSTSYTIDYYT